MVDHEGRQDEGLMEKGGIGEMGVLVFVAAGEGGLLVVIHDNGRA